jgi:3-oxoacyl-[acyl-carrier-protein] synthase-1
MKPLSVAAAGLATGVGLDANAACAAMRAGISASTETRFMVDGEWLLGCPVPLDPPLRGLDRLAHLAASAIGECLAKTQADPRVTPLILCVAEKDRPGRLGGLDDALFPAVQGELNVKFHAKSAVIARGRAGVGHALRLAERLVHEGGAPFCIVAGVDSLLVAGTIASLARRGRLLTPNNSNGFIPGEAAAAVALSAPGGRGPGLVCSGVGQATERVTVESEEPLRADGLVAAMRAALADAGRTFDDVHYRITDISGEQYAFREAALAIGRAIRKVKPRFDLWHPAECIGESGAAVGPAILAVALAAGRKGYAPGPGVLCHVGNDDGERAVIVLRWEARA